MVERTLRLARDLRSYVLIAFALSGLLVATAVTDDRYDLLASRPASELKLLAWAAVSVQALTAVWLLWRWWTTRRGFLAWMTFALTALTVSSALFIDSEQRDWWTVRGGIVGAALIAGVGLLFERVRHGRIRQAVDADVLARVAEQIVLSMGDGLAVTDEAGRLVGWNPAARKLTGLSRSAAAKKFAGNVPDGIHDFPGGRWAELQPFEVERYGRSYTVTLITDASDQVSLRDRSNFLEEEVAERTGELHHAQREVIERLAMAAEYRDDDTGEHTIRVGRAAALVAEQLGLDANDVELLRNAAPLHDVGKIGIPDPVLLKEGKLTEAEFELMQRHTTMGARMLAGRSFALLRMAEDIALNHHERWNGTGYPRGIEGEDIPLVARITSVCDVYDALTHERPYKQAWSREAACAEIRACAGTHFDPTVVEAFLVVEAREDLLSVVDHIDHESEQLGLQIDDSQSAVQLPDSVDDSN